MALGFLRFLFHVEHLVLFVHHDDTRALQLLDAWLLVTHDATGLLLQGKIDKLLEREEEKIVSSDDEEVSF